MSLLHDALLTGADPLAHRVRGREEADMDVTPMIDITFLLLIYFTVATTRSLQSPVELPPARYGVGVSEHNAVIFTITADDAGGGQVFAGDLESEPLSRDKEQQFEQIAEAVRRGVADGKQSVIIKAEGGVKHQMTQQVAAAVGAAGDVRLYYAVLEKQGGAE